MQIMPPTRGRPIAPQPRPLRADAVGSGPWCALPWLHVGKERVDLRDAVISIASEYASWLGCHSACAR